MEADGRTLVRDSTDWSRVAFGVALGAFAAYQQFKLPPILPDFLARYPHDPVIAAGFMSVYALVGLLASAPIGRHLDMYLGRGIILLFVLTVIGITVALVAPWSSPLMLASRGIEGLAFALAALAGPAIAAGAARPHDLPLVTGLLAGWIPMGQIAAALAALAFDDWRWLWLLGLGMTVPLAAWGWFLLGGARRGATVARVPGRRPDAAQHRALIFAGAIFLLWSAQYFAFMTWLTQYLTVVLALDRAAAVLAYLVPVVVLLTCSILTGWGLRHRLPLVPALTAALLGQTAIWFAQPWLSGMTGIAGLVIYGIGAGVTPACLFHLPHAIARRPAGAAFFGTLMTGRNIGVLLGPILLAELIGTGSHALGLGWTAGARVMAGITALAMAAALRLGPALRHS